MTQRWPFFTHMHRRQRRPADQTSTRPYWFDKPVPVPWLQDLLRSVHESEQSNSDGEEALTGQSLVRGAGIRLQ